MDNKYYTPDIEDFHVGFEYEEYYNDIWNKEIITIDSYGGNISGGFFHDTLMELKDNNIRVKYLTKEDIESLGFTVESIFESEYWPSITFKKTFKEDIFTFNYYITFNFKHDRPYIYTNIDIATDDIIKTRIKGVYPKKILFSGGVKNKVELKKLLKQLNIAV